MSGKHRHKRRIKLILPRLQLRLTLTFLGFAALGFLVQFLLVLAGLPGLAAKLPNDSQPMLEGMQALLLRSFVISLLVFGPILFWVGVLSTFRLAGPIYRFRVFLGQVMRGEHPGECRIRKKDQLQDFCTLLNEVTAPLRAQSLDPDSILAGGPTSDEDEGEARISKAS